MKISEPTFSHVFANEAETPFDQAPFVGWDLTQINPRSLQDTDPLCNYVFAYPDDSSHAYHKSEWGKQKTMPNGVMYVSSVHSDSLTRTAFASSERDIQSSWTTSFGAKLGMGETTLFKSNNTFRQSVKNSMTKAASSTVSLFTIESHLLLVDFPRVALHEQFAAIEKIVPWAEAKKAKKLFRGIAIAPATRVTSSAKFASNPLTPEGSCVGDRDSVGAYKRSGPEGAATDSGLARRG